MDKEDKETLKHISCALDQILVVLSKPQNKVIRIFEVVSTAITIAGIIGLIDILIQWFGG